MQSVILVLAPIVLALSLAFGSFAVWIGFRRHKARIEGRRHPMKEPLLRPPGFTLGRRSEELVSEGVAALLMAILSIIVVFASHASQTAYLGIAESPLRLMISLIAASGMAIWFIRYGIHCLQEHRDCRLGWEGELAVAEALLPLAAKGFRIFHDVPANRFNIDHVVVGPTGVFAIETKVRIKRAGTGAHKLKFDGENLIFPNYTTVKPIQQAEAQARWLHDFLSSAIAKQVRVQPVLCLPGWYVDRTGRGKVAVQSAKNCHKYFEVAQQGSVLDEQTIGMIAHQLDAKCRDVALGEQLL